MADRQLTTVLNSGEVNTIYLGGTAATDKVIKQSELTASENSASSFASFSYSKVSVPVTVTNAVYEPIVSISETKLAGTYQVTQSLLYSLDSASNSVYFRFSVDNGATWTEVNNEPKDTTNKMPLTSSYVLVHAGGTMSIRVEAKKENAADVFVIYTADLMAERKI